MELKERIYTAVYKNNFFKMGKEILADFRFSNQLGIRLAQRNLKAKYRQSLFGFFWLFVPSIAISLVWIFLSKAKVIQFDNVSGGYSAYVISGTILWQIFSLAIVAPISTIQANRSLIVKLNIPKEALFLNALYEVLFVSLISLVVLFTALGIVGVYPSINFIFIVPLVILLILFALVIGLFLIPISMVYKDVSFGLPTVLQFAMYFSPVVFPATVFIGSLSFLNYNPVNVILIQARNILFNSGTEICYTYFLILFLVLILLLVVGIFLQRIALEILTERMGS